VEDEATNLYKYSGDGCWPGTDSVMLSYYQYELGNVKLDGFIYNLFISQQLGIRMFD